MLSEHDARLSNTRSSPIRCQGSRLKNKVGLNITEDEYVANKLKEREQKQTRPRKAHLPKEGTATNPATKANIKRSRKSTAKSKNKNKNITDPQVAKTVQQLENIIQLTQETFDDSTSDEENFFTSIGVY